MARGAGVVPVGPVAFSSRLRCFDWIRELVAPDPGAGPEACRLRLAPSIRPASADVPVCSLRRSAHLTASPLPLRRVAALL
jgi:hypothetical protein